jgi:hypothetical protein
MLLLPREAEWELLSFWAEYDGYRVGIMEYRNVVPKRALSNTIGFERSQRLQKRL